MSVQRDSSDIENGGVLFRKKCKAIVGVKDSELAEQLILNAADALEPILGSVKSKNVILQALNNYQPKDLIEAQLVTQSVIAHFFSMSSIRQSSRAKMIPNADTMGNLGIKAMRAQNETVETLCRYRRGGEQKVTVTHSVLAAQAVVNFPGVRVPTKNLGETPCSMQNAEQKREPINIDHVGSQPCQMDGVAFTEEKAVGLKRKRVKKG